MGQIEEHFSWAKSMERYKETERNCFKKYATCTLHSADITFGFYLLMNNVTWYSKHCWRMASLRRSENLVEAENSTSAMEVGLEQSHLIYFDLIIVSNG